MSPIIQIQLEQTISLNIVSCECAQSESSGVSRGVDREGHGRRILAGPYILAHCIFSCITMQRHSWYNIMIIAH